jgi:uncharacterized membrane protein
VSLYQWLLFLHVAGAFLLVGGTVAAATLTIASRRRERPSEVALLLRLVSSAVFVIGAGVAATLIFGLWLVHESPYGYSYGQTWVIAAVVLWVVSNALGGVGGNREKKIRQLAERLVAAGDAPSPELTARLRDPVSLVLNFGSGAVVFVILALMIWKPGA